MKKIRSITYALLAAAFYAVSIPFSKVLLNYVGPTTMAGLLYLGAGLGISIIYLFNRDKQNNKLEREDLPFVIGMIVLDILAPILLILGISFGTSSNASLLSNFEIVATTIIALIIFKEAVSNKLWIAIFLIILASILLSFESLESFQFSFGSLFVLLATICWGMENNCTRRISSKNTYEIVILKGLFCGCGSLLIGLIIGESINEKYFILPAILLGFVSYGLSIFLYIKAQKDLGAAKTSAYYAIAPFIGVIFSFFFLKEKITINYFIALLIMIIATILVVLDTLRKQHSHLHDHSFEIKYNGSIQRFTIKHSHRHNHYDSEINHNHYHSKKELIKELKSF